MALLSIGDAGSRVLDGVRPLPTLPLPLADIVAGGRIRYAAESIAATTDQPPFDKALMDGWAIGPPHSDADPGDRIAYAVSGEVVAGVSANVATRPLQAGEAVRIMTGAVVPPGAIAVVPWEAVFARSESSRARTADAIAVPIEACQAERFLLRRGALVRAGMRLLSAGAPLTALALAMLAEQGHVHVAVPRVPRVTVLSTGDELASGAGPLIPGQIRNSNGAILTACLTTLGCEVLRATTVADELSAVASAVAQATSESDVVLLTGGVSAGTRDVVPAALAHLGIEPIFHGVDIKPGKPLLYARTVGSATRATDSSGPVHLFGLPGNPLAVRVTWEVFVRPLLRRLLGAETGPEIVVRTASLAADFAQTDSRPTFWPARKTDEDEIVLLPWQGSADIIGAVGAEAFAVLPGGPATLPAGLRVPYWPMTV